MKKLFSILLAGAMLFSLAACGQKPKNDCKLPPDPKSAATAFQQEFHLAHTAESARGCAADNGYYFVGGKHFVHFVEKETMKSTILCGKPQCRHTDQTCNASVPWAEHITWYDGRLYYDGPNDKDGTWCLYAMDADGTNHAQVQELWPSANGVSTMQLQFVLNHGLICFVSNEGKEVRAGKLGDRLEDTVLLLLTDNEIIEGDEFTGNEYQLWADGSYFYIMVVEKQYKYFKQTLYCYDPEKGSVEAVWTVPDQAEVGTWDTAGVTVNGWTVRDGSLYYFLSGNGVYQYSFEEQANKRLFACKEESTAAFDRESVYIDNRKNAISVYDFSGKLAGTLDYSSIYHNGGMAGSSLGVRIAGTDEQYLFLVTHNFSQGSGSDTQLYYCKKASIGAEKPQPLFGS